MVACAMLAAFFMLRADLIRRGLVAPSDKLPVKQPGKSSPHVRTSANAEAEMLIAIPCLAGIVGAKLYHVLESPADFFAHPLDQLLSPYGFAWFGGLLAGFAAFVLVGRCQKIPFLTLLDAGSPAAALGYGIGRIGCFLSGDGDYGIPTSLPWGMSFPNGLVPTAQRVHPTPIYELIIALLIAAWLWRRGAKSGRLSAGHITGEYLVLSGVARFLVEFIRINPRIYWGMSNAQVASLGSIAAGILLIMWARRHSTTATADAAEVLAATSRQ